MRACVKHTYIVIGIETPIPILELELAVFSTELELVNM